MGSEEIERLLVRVEANAYQFEAQMKRVNRALHGASAEVRKTRQTFKREMESLGRDVYQPVQAASALALGAIVAFSIQAAKRAEAVEGAFETTFAAMPERAKAATQAIADDFKRLETDIKDNFTQLQSVMTGLGVDAEAALGVVDALQRRSLDIAAFKDVSDAQAFQAVISGITGETEPLKRFGVVVNETAVKTELLRLGFKGNATQASESAKAIARANIILQRTAQMEGQVAREADTLAGSQKEATDAFRKSAEEFGKQFLPIAAKVLTWAVDCLEKFNALPSGVQNAALAFLGLVAVGGPIASLIKGLGSVIKAALAARAAIAAIGAVPPLAGAAGGTVAGATAGGGGAGAAARAGVLGSTVVGVGLLVSQASFAPAPGADDFVNDPSFVARRLGESERDWRARGGFTRTEWEARRRRAAAAPPSSPASDPSAEQIGGPNGDFGLSDAQMRPVGGSGGGRGSGAGDAQRIAAAREALTLERAIATARASGDEAAITAAERREQLAGLVEQYAAAGYTDAQAQAEAHLALLDQAAAKVKEREAAEVQIDLILQGRDRQLAREAQYQRMIQDQLMDRLSMAAELAQLSGDEGVLRDLERQLWVEDRINQLLELRLAMTPEDARGIAENEHDQRRAASIRGGLSSSRDDNAVSIREEELSELADLEEQGLLTYQELQERRAQIDADYRQRRLTGEGTMLEQISQLSNSSIKELAAIGKAAALAQATIDGYGAIQRAWNSASFPANLPAVAITTAATASNIAGIAGTGFERGGYTGDGGVSQVAGVVHGKEYVFDAATTRRIGVGALDAMRRGATLLDGVGSAASAISGSRAAGGDTIHFAPSIDARGADRAAVKRLERALEDQARGFGEQYLKAHGKRLRFETGTRRKK